MSIALSHSFFVLLYRLCVDDTLNDITKACRIGKLAMSLLKYFDLVTSQMPKLFYTHALLHGGCVLQTGAILRE